MRQETEYKVTITHPDTGDVIEFDGILDKIDTIIFALTNGDSAALLNAERWYGSRLKDKLTAWHIIYVLPETQVCDIQASWVEQLRFINKL